MVGGSGWAKKFKIPFIKLLLNFVLRGGGLVVGLVRKMKI